MQTTAAIVQARLGSSRLPAKVLLPLPNGRTVLEEVLHRCWQIEGVDKVVAAIPDTAENNILETLIAKMAFFDGGKVGELPLKAHIVRGPEHDVLSRYIKAVEAVGAQVILRITSDCPLLDPEVCGELLKLRERTAAGYASNSWPARSYPVGFDCEAVTRGALEMADYALAPDAPEREHVGLAWIQQQPVVKKALLKAMDDRSHLRWTLDEKDDFVTIWNVMEKQMREAA
jgi:spore coat polysaccharide biosynthesis protein SpsF